MTIERNVVATFIAFLITALFTAASAAEKQSDYARVVPLVATSQTILDESISYPWGHGQDHLRDRYSPAGRKHRYPQTRSPDIWVYPVGRRHRRLRHARQAHLSGRHRVHGSDGHLARWHQRRARSVPHPRGFHGNGQKRQCHQKIAARFPPRPYGSNTVEPVVSRAARARCALAASLSAKVWLTSILTTPELIALNRLLARASRSFRVAV